MTQVSCQSSKKDLGQLDFHTEKKEIQSPSSHPFQKLIEVKHLSVKDKCTKVLEQKRGEKF